MTTSSRSNGADSLAKSPVGTLSVPDNLRLRIEAAHKAVEEDHQGGLTLQQFLNALLWAGLENVEYADHSHHSIPCCKALGGVADPYQTRGHQKDCMSFLRWRVGIDVSWDGELTRVIRIFDDRLLIYLADLVSENRKPVVADPIDEKGRD